MVLLQAESIRHSYRGTLACSVPGIGFTGGMINAVVGPSGAGKTTFLRILAGLIVPDEGQVWYRGEPLYRKVRGRAGRTECDLDGMVMVFQEPQLFRGTVRCNLEYGLRLRRTDRPLREARVTQVAGLLGLQDALDWQVGSLSAGEAQRVALGRALVLEPGVVILDEPTASLDPVNIRTLETALVQACSEWNVAVVMVTHNLAQARRIADRISFFDSGRLQSTEPVEAFFREPSTGKQRAFLEGDAVG